MLAPFGPPTIKSLATALAKGRINKVIGEVIEYSLYNIDTEELSCGFPLLNEQLKVVGIHVNSKKLEERVVLTAINIGFILECFKNFIIY